MKPSHTIRLVFDDPNLVSAAGLVPALRLAESAGLFDLLNGLSVPSANAVAKTAAVLGGMLAGADSIDDLDLLRHGGMGRLFTGVRAPSTLGTFLRSFTHGHVQQVDKVSGDLLAGLAMRVATSQTGAAWNEFFADLPGASWQRSRIHNAFNLMGVTPKTMWPAVKAMLHGVYDQPDAAAVQAQTDRLLDYVGAKLPESTTISTELAPACCLSPCCPIWTQIWSHNPTERPNKKSAATPTLSESSPTATPSSASSARSWPSRPTNGPKAAATSGSTSSPAPASPSSPPPPDLTRAPRAAARVSVR